MLFFFRAALGVTLVAVHAFLSVVAVALALAIFVYQVLYLRSMIGGFKSEVQPMDYAVVAAP